MTFALQTLFALLTSVALSLACVRSPALGVGIMAFLLPFSMMIIGITSPQRGNQLDPSKRWYFFALLKTWAFTLCGLILLMLTFAIYPNLHSRLVRGLNGDTRRYQVTITFSGDWKTSEGLRDKRRPLYDSRGFVGEIRNAGFTKKLRNGNVVDSLVWVLVSTDREDALKRDWKQFKVETRSDGSLYVRD